MGTHYCMKRMFRIGDVTVTTFHSETTLFDDQFKTRLHYNNSLLVSYYNVEQNQATDLMPNKSSIRTF